MQVSQEPATVMSLPCRVDVALVFKDNLHAVKVEVISSFLATVMYYFTQSTLSPVSLIENVFC